MNIHSDWNNRDKKQHDAITKCMNDMSRGKTTQTMEGLPGLDTCIHLEIDHLET